MAKKSAAEWSETITELQDQRKTAEARLKELDAEREPLSLPARTGDAKARKALDAVNAERRQLADEIDELVIAIAEAGKHLLDAQERERQADYDRRVREIEKLAKEGEALAAELDADIKPLQDKLQRIDEIRHQIYSTARDPRADSPVVASLAHRRWTTWARSKMGRFINFAPGPTPAEVSFTDLVGLRPSIIEFDLRGEAEQRDEVVRETLLRVVEPEPDPEPETEPKHQNVAFMGLRG